jgi:hypothetical protein
MRERTEFLGEKQGRLEEVPLEPSIEGYGESRSLAPLHRHPAEWHNGTSIDRLGEDGLSVW